MSPGRAIFLVTPSPSVRSSCNNFAKADAMASGDGELLFFVGMGFLLAGFFR